MGNTEIDIQEMIHVMQAIENYRKLAYTGSQIDPKQREVVNPWYNNLVEMYSNNKKYPDEQFLSVWKSIDVHIINQVWGSTACGWGGIGGAAMTNAYTTIIENYPTKSVFVYYSGKLAYICHMDDKYMTITDKQLPDIAGSSRKLNIIYKNNR